MLFFQWRKWLFKKFLKKDRHFSLDPPHNKYVFLRTLYIFPERKNTLKGFENNTNIDIKYGIAYFRIMKKKVFLKNEKNGKLKTVGNLENIFPSFLISDFSILVIGQKTIFKEQCTGMFLDLLYTFASILQQHKN